MSDSTLMTWYWLKWFMLLTFSFIADNWVYFWVVVLTFAGNYWYRQKFNIKLTRFEWVKLFLIGAIVSITIFESLATQVIGDMARSGATSFIAVIGMEVYPILIQVLKDITPAIVRKRAGLKKDD